MTGSPLSTTPIAERSRHRAVAPASSTAIESAAEREVLIAAIFLAEPVPAQHTDITLPRARPLTAPSHRLPGRRLAVAKSAVVAVPPVHAMPSKPARYA